MSTTRTVADTLDRSSEPREPQDTEQYWQCVLDAHLKQLIALDEQRKEVQAQYELCAKGRGLAAAKLAEFQKRG